MIIPAIPLVATLIAHVAGLPERPAHVETVESAVRRLSPGLTQAIEVSPKLGGTLVFLLPNGASAQTSLRALAKALHASIEATPRGLVLERTPLDLKRAEQDRALEREGWIQTKLDDVSAFREARTKARSLSTAVLDEVGRASRTSEEIARGLRLSPDPEFATELLPAEGLLTSLIRRIGKGKLAEVPIGRVKVWEDAPVAGATALPPHEEAMSSYLATIDALRQVDLPTTVKTRLSALGMTQFFSDWSQSTANPVRLRLEVRAQETMDVISLSGYDASGNQVLVSALIAQPSKVWRPPALIVRDDFQRDKARWADLPKESLAAIAATSDDVVAHPPSWFTAPETTEPLDSFATDSLGALASMEPGRCVAVQVVDSVLDDVRASVVKGRLNVDAFKTMLKEWSRYERIEGNGFVVWRPTGSIVPAACQADRKALGAFARTVLRTKVLNLRTLCGYHERLGEEAPTSLALYWSRTFRGAQAVRSLSGDASHDFYRLLGSMPEESWRLLESGRRMSVGYLGLQERLASLLDEDRTPVQSSGPFPDVLRHPRESFPDGAIQNASVAIAYRPRELLGVQSPQGDGIIQWSEGIPVLSILSVEEAPEKGLTYSMTREQYEHWLRALRFQLATQSETTVTLSFLNGTSAVATFTDPLTPTTALGGYDDLPVKVRESIWRKARESATPARASRGADPRLSGDPIQP